MQSFEKVNCIDTSVKVKSVFFGNHSYRTVIDSSDIAMSF